MKGLVYKKKVDMRVDKSINLLCDAMIELLKKNHIDDIRITKIAEMAGVARLTFYNHFDNKSSLLRECFNRLMQPAVEKIETLVTHSHSKDDLLLGIIKVIVTHVNINRELLYLFIENDHGKTVYWALNNFINNVFILINKKYLYFASSYLPSLLVEDFIIGGLTYIVYDLIKQNNYFDEKLAIDYFYDLIENFKYSVATPRRELFKDSKNKVFEILSKRIASTLLTGKNLSLITIDRESCPDIYYEFNDIDMIYILVSNLDSIDYKLLKELGNDLSIFDTNFILKLHTTVDTDKKIVNLLESFKSDDAQNIFAIITAKKNLAWMN